MSRLFSNQVNKNKEKIHICNYCLQNFRNEKTLKNHLEYCSKYKCGKTVYPNKGEKLKFKNYERIHNLPFVIYADFECSLKFENKTIGKPVGDQPPRTNQFQKHEPSGFCYLIKCFDDNLYKPKLVMYTCKENEISESVSSKFVEMLENDIKEIHKQFKFPKRPIFRSEGLEGDDFKKADKCYACGSKFKDNGKVRDHCYYTGKYRGAACTSCNSKMKNPKFIPVIFHNLQNYDSHLFIKNLGVSEGEINCIPNTEEKYISFTKEIIVDKFVSEKIINEKQFEKLNQNKSNESKKIEYEVITTEDQKNPRNYKIKEIINVKNKLDLLIVLNLCQVV